MNKKLLFALWGILYILCAGLGFLPEPEGAARFLLTALAVVFFLPPAILLATGDLQSRKLIRNLSIASLSLTVVLIIANVLSIRGSTALGDGLYAMLIVISSPMVCGGNWLISLFLWACLLTVSIQHSKKH